MAGGQCTMENLVIINIFKYILTYDIILKKILRIKTKVNKNYRIRLILKQKIN